MLLHMFYVINVLCWKTGSDRKEAHHLPAVFAKVSEPGKVVYLHLQFQQSEDRGRKINNVSKYSVEITFNNSIKFIIYL